MDVGNRSPLPVGTEVVGNFDGPPVGLEVGLLVVGLAVGCVDGCDDG